MQQAHAEGIPVAPLRKQLFAAADHLGWEENGARRMLEERHDIGGPGGGKRQQVRYLRVVEGDIRGHEAAAMAESPPPPRQRRRDGRHVLDAHRRVAVHDGFGQRRRARDLVTHDVYVLAAARKRLERGFDDGGEARAARLLE